MHKLDTLIEEMTSLAEGDAISPHVQEVAAEAMAAYRKGAHSDNPQVMIDSAFGFADGLGRLLAEISRLEKERRKKRRKERYAAMKHIYKRNRLAREAAKKKDEDDRMEAENRFESLSDREKWESTGCRCFQSAPCNRCLDTCGDCGGFYPYGEGECEDCGPNKNKDE